MTPIEGATSSDPLSTAASTPASAPPVDPVKQRRTQFAYLAAALVGYLAFGIILPLIRIRPHSLNFFEGMLAFFAPTLIFMFLQLWVPWCLVRIRQEFTSEIKEFVVCLALWILLSYGFHAHRSDGLLVWLGTPALTNLMLTIVLTLGGSMIAKMVREAKILLPLGIVAGVIDIVGAMTPIGFTAHMVQSHPEVVQHASVQVPAFAGLLVHTTIGAGDPLFIAFFFSVVHRHKLNTAATFPLVYALLTLSLLAVQFRLIAQIGALAPLGLAVIIANWKYFKFSREEKFAMLYAGLISIAAAVAFFLYTNAHVFKAAGP